MRLRINTTPFQAPCSCLNQYLLTPGSLCDICMGQVPAREAEAAKETSSRFDDDYFEALEHALDMIEPSIQLDPRRAA